MGPPESQSCLEICEWQDLLDSLRIHHSLFGDLIIESAFVVPMEEPWPRRLWGRGLARLVYDISFWKKHLALAPERRELLSALGFVWGRLASEYTLVVEALLVFRDIHGDLLVPRSFVCPSSPPWPPSVWSMPLGRRVSMIRTRGDYLKDGLVRWHQLESMGFVWEARDAEWDRVLGACAVYSRYHGHLNVPRAFEVPLDDAWPRHLAGLKLGIAINNMRANKSFLSRHPHRLLELERLGFVQDTRAFAFDVVCETLATFKQIYNHTRVPQRFVVPTCEPWHPSSWNLPLGRRVFMIRTRGDFVRGLPERIDRLDQLGFEWNPNRGRLLKDLSKASSSSRLSTD